MRTRLRLFLDWGITFGEPYQIPEHGQRKVYYAGRQELEAAIQNRYWTGPEQGSESAQEEKEQDRPSQKGRPMWGKAGISDAGEQMAQDTVRAISFAKKVEALPLDSDSEG